MSKKKDLISIIVPCFNEQEAIPFFYDEMSRVASKLDDADIEMLFINDGSSDDTLGILRTLAKKDTRVRYVSFSRNFGKEAAMFAGLQNAKGDYIAIMDADLQDPPSLLPEMYKTLKEEDFDSVATRRSTRKGEPPVRTLFAKMFYRLINKISKVELVSGARDYRLMTRRMVDSVLSLTEYNRFSKGIFQWVGYKTKWLSYENIERVAGKTKWSFWKLFVYSLECIIAFSTAPLSLASFLGFLFCVLALVGIVFVIIRQIIYGGSAFGWPSMVCITMLIGGLQLFCIGILGQYLSKTYLETKKRPIYLVAETEEDARKK